MDLLKRSLRIQRRSHPSQPDPRTATLRSTLVACHRWIGLSFAVLLFVQGLSGAALVFRAELNRAVHRDALIVTPLSARLSLQSIVETARRAHPQLEIERIDFPRRSDEAFVVRMQAEEGADLRHVAIDPYRAAITRDAPIESWPIEWLFKLHQQMLAGHRGETLVGVVGAALLLLALSALFIWWPGGRTLRRGFTVVLSAGAYRGVRDLHRVGGVFLVVFLLIWGATGVVIVWKGEIQAALARVTPMATKPMVESAPRTGAALAPLDQIVAAAQKKYEHAAVKNVRFPGGHGRVVLVFLETTSTTRPRASDQIWIDGYTGATLGVYEAQALPAGNRVIEWMLPVHTGEVFGTLCRLLFLLAAVGLCGLAGSGAWQWWKRRQLQALPPLPARSRPVSRPDLLDVVVARAWDETPRVRALELRALAGGSLPPFEAGAHIDLHLPQGVIRQYSIWSDPLDRTRYCIAVLRQADSRGGSIAAHALQAGVQLRIGQPRNTFALRASAPAFLFVAGGIGITPLLPMAARVAELRRPLEFHYCVRRREDAPFVARLQERVPERSLILHFGDEPHPGRFDARALLAAAAAETHAYVCGPARLIDAVLMAGRALGWAQHRLHSELFQAAPPDVDSQAFDVHLFRSGRIVHVPAGRSALAALAAHGVVIPSSCGTGICGTCITTVLDGTPDHRDRYLSGAERERGAVFTPCCSRARTPVLVLDL